MKKLVKLFITVFFITSMLCTTIPAFAADGNTPQNETLTNYTGENFSGEVTGKIKTDGNQVLVFEDDTYRYEYQYDDNGVRIGKTIYTLPYSSKSTPIWQIGYIWQGDQIVGYTYTDDNQQQANLSICRNDAGVLEGFLLNGTKYDLITDGYEEITGLKSGNQVWNISYDSQNKICLPASASSTDTELLKMILLTVPFSMNSTVLDYESGYEYDFNAVDSVPAPIIQRHSDTAPEITPFASNSKIVVYLPTPQKASLNPFGHLEIKINFTIHSYATYNHKEGNGNYLITGDTIKYHDYQRTHKNYKITFCFVNVTASQNSSVLSFYTAQSKIKIRTPSEYYKGTIYKIQLGKYKNYILTEANCATFVLDGLKKAFASRINYLTNLYGAIPPTPTKIFKICENIN